MLEVQRGTLAQLSLPALLAQLFASRHTGAVQLSQDLPPGTTETADADRGRVQIFFRSGYPVDVLNPASGDRLGVVLLELGLLDRDRYLRAQALRPTAGKLIGEQMLEARLIDRRSIRDGLRAQVRRRLNALFLREELAATHYQIFSGPHARGMGDGESLASDPRRIIYFGVRRAYAPERLQEAMARLHGLDVQLQPTEATEAARWLPQSEQRMAQLLQRGAWSVAGLIAGAQVHPQAVLAFLYTYTLTNGLIMKTASSAQRRGSHSASAVRSLPYQVSDEPLSAAESPAAALASERPVLMRVGQQTSESVPGAAGRPRTTVLMQLQAPPPEPPALPVTSMASSGSVRAPAPPSSSSAAARPALAPTSAPSPSTPDLKSEVKTWTAPPLRTSLPVQRLPQQPTTTTPTPRPTSGGSSRIPRPRDDDKR